ncbi:MAG: hypothetical protein LUH05_08320 [Candidatus Gastranaerophilales bacterium]|nr:hypothetical protein [Candidatus Gastranaerophilales bacterium]
MINRVNSDNKKDNISNAVKYGAGSAAGGIIGYNIKSSPKDSYEVVNNLGKVASLRKTKTINNSIKYKNTILGGLLGFLCVFITKSIINFSKQKKDNLEETKK